VQIVTKKVGQIFEADIRSYFTRINHQWLRKMVAHRIADPVILGLIGKWLNAGAMQDGVVIYTGEGTPQGGPISPVLSNLYLHFVLDLWFEKKIKPQCRGEANLVRFADDFVVSFQFREDVDQFQQRVRERFAEFGLELAEEKTRRILFGRFAGVTCLRHGLGRPDTFEFLGFKHVCGIDRTGRFALIRIPSVKSCRKFLTRTREWILHNRHWRRWEQQQHLQRMLRGFYQYFGLHHCERKLNWVRQQIQRQWMHALNRRGQRRKTNWARLKDQPWFKLPFAQNLHPMT
jgi:group II intron reverse transcriptase/maturase